MELQGVVEQILPKQTFNGRNGEISIYAFILNTGSEYPKQVKFDVWGDDKWGKMIVNVGSNVSVSFDISSRQWNDKWFTKCEAWRVTPIDASNGVSGTQAQEQAPVVPQAPKQPSAQQESSNANDLPF